MKRIGTLLAALCMLAATNTHADGFLWGPQGGFSVEPSQVAFGFHVVAPVTDRFDILPSFDIGIGDDVFTFALNGDVRMNLAPASSLKPYVAAGVTFYNVDPDGDAESVNDIGVGLGGGIWLNKGGQTSYYIDAKVGVENVPDFKAMLGINF